VTKTWNNKNNHNKTRLYAQEIHCIKIIPDLINTNIKENKSNKADKSTGH